MVIGVGVTRDQSVMQPGFGTSFGSATIWEYSVSSPPRLVLAQGESLQTPTAQYFLEGGVFNALTSNFTYGKDSQYVLRAEDLGDGDETAIFVGLPRTETAYTAYESVGASSLEYRVGSLDILPVPFTEDNYFTGLAALRVSGDGQLLFSAVVQDASDSDQRVSRSAGLWIADSANTLRQLIEPGSTHPTVNGDPITISGVDPDIIYDNGVLLNDGNIAYFDSVLGTDLFIELVMQ